MKELRRHFCRHFEASIYSADAKNPRYEDIKHDINLSFCIKLTSTKDETGEEDNGAVEYRLQPMIVSVFRAVMQQTPSMVMHGSLVPEFSTKELEINDTVPTSWMIARSPFFHGPSRLEHVVALIASQHCSGESIRFGVCFG
jgi:hypothetical protein